MPSAWLLLSPLVLYAVFRICERLWLQYVFSAWLLLSPLVLYAVFRICERLWLQYVLSWYPYRGVDSPFWSFRAPVIGNLVELLKNKERLAHRDLELSVEMGTKLLSHFNFTAKTPTLFCYDPRDVKHFLEDDFDAFVKGRVFKVSCLFLSPPPPHPHPSPSPHILVVRLVC
jgi:hypothetical protein